jgi:hypothetical protein
MRPEIWGNSFWNTINAIALSYPDKPDVQDQQNVTTFLTSLRDVLPCEQCREHFRVNLKKFPLSQALTSRSDFIKWVIDVRNSVNQMNGKRTLSYSEGKYQMEKNLYGSSINKYHIMGGMVVGIVMCWYLRNTKLFKKLLK